MVNKINTSIDHMQKSSDIILSIAQLNLSLGPQFAKNTFKSFPPKCTQIHELSNTY